MLSRRTGKQAVTSTALFAANRGYALKSSREAIIRRFLDRGWQVVLATADDSEAHELAKLGAAVEAVQFNRGGFAPLADGQAWLRLRDLFAQWQPSLVHFFHAKPVMLGVLAARKSLGDQVQIVNTITGLGHAFITGGFTARLAGLGYRLALPRSDRTIFQNRDDLKLFRERGWVNEERATLIAGSGIDLARFSFVDRRGVRRGSPVIVMLGRLLRQKGIPEFIEVARRIRSRFPGARFLLAGEEDPVHPDAVKMDWLQQQDCVEYLGRLADVRLLFEEADLLLFPSYREGVPRVVMEAAATGLPTVAFDVPGVREAVRNGLSGYLVPDRDTKALTQRVIELLENREQRLAMGEAARTLAEKAFDIRVIQEQYLNIYRSLGINI